MCYKVLVSKRVCAGTQWVVICLVSCVCDRFVRKWAISLAFVHKSAWELIESRKLSETIYTGIHFCQGWKNYFVQINYVIQINVIWFNTKFIHFQAFGKCPWHLYAPWFINRLLCYNKSFTYLLAYLVLMTSENRFLPVLIGLLQLCTGKT